MSVKHILKTGLLALLLSPAILAYADDSDNCAPQWQAGWIRLMPANTPMLAGYGQLVNSCTQPVAIVAASSPAFAEISIHQTQMIEGISRMREMDELVVAPASSTTLEPGGLHLMLMQPVAPLKSGDIVEVELVLKDGSTISAPLEVREQGVSTSDEHQHHH